MALSEEKQNEIVQARIEGLSIAQVAEHVGVSYSSAFRYCDKNREYIDASMSEEARHVSWTAISEEKQRQIAEARAIGLSVTTIAKMLDVSESTIFKYCKETGGDERLIQTTIEVMQKLKEQQPVEWLKRFAHKRDFVSADSARLSMDVDGEPTDGKIVINLDFSGEADA